MSNGYRYAPEFRITINGEPIPTVLRASISQLTYQTGLEGADRVELQIANERLRWLDHPLFDMGNDLELFLGYAPDNVERVFVGEVVSQSAAFPSSSMPTLTVAAQDRMYRLQRGTKARWFAIPVPTMGNLPMPDLVVGTVVATENRLIPAFDPVGAALSILLTGVQALALVDGSNQVQKLIRRQDGVSDYDFLKQIALENGWEMFIDHSGATGGYRLRFMSPLDDLTPDVFLRYGANLVDFHPRISDVGQIAGVSVNLWESNLKIAFKVTVGWDWDRASLTLSVVPSYGGIGEDMAQPAESGVINSNFILVNEPVTKANAARVIMSKLIPRLNQRLTAQATTVGDIRLRAGSVLQIEGVGKTFGGRYRIVDATHTVGANGFTSQINVRQDVWFQTIPLPEQGAVPIHLE